MAAQYSIREISEEEMLDQLPLLQQLSPQVKPGDYKRMLADMLAHGYRMVGVFDNRKCIGISGFWISTKFYCDKYLEPDNVVIDKKYRSKGIGEKLMKWLEAEARRSGCRTLILDAYVENFSGHRFYYRQGFIARGYHFLKKL